MSARRARIKAVVTSFPARRKNNDVADNTKAKIPEKETIEKPTRAQDNFDKRSPKPGSPLKSPSPLNDVIKIYQSESTVPPSSAQTEVIKEVAVTPKRSEEFSVNTSVTPDVFVSPRNVGSPLVSHVVSPLVHSSEVEVNVQKLTPATPEKIPEKPKQESAESTPVEVDVTDGKSKETMKSMKGVVNTIPADVSDDYSVASLPDSTTEDNVMDGIVPLQVVSSAPKPVALLKNEIISENAEVLFDPIVPLPAPSKARPKLRPVPRLAPLRRSSVQASVSEADDESRRALLSGGGASTSAAPRQAHDSHDLPHSTMHSLPNRDVKRIRNESVSSSVSQATTQPSAASSPVKEKHLSKCRRMDMPRRMPAMRRLRETGKKDTLTMYDLIFTNPRSNPIVPYEAQLSNEKEEAARKAAIEQEKDMEDQTEMEIDVAPVPQIKLGPDGEIILDEKSLVIKQSEKRKVSSSIVHEGASGSTSSGYRRTKRTALWKDAETVRFYRALASLGTDFMLMENLFPGRTRRDLKLKFKREERVNLAQVEKALRSTCKWDATRLENEFRVEREEAEKAALELKQRAIDMKRQEKEARKLCVPKSRGAKALGESAVPSPNTGRTADELILQHPEAQQSTASSQSATTTRVMPKSKSNDMATIRKKDTKSQGKAPVKQPPKTPELPANVEEGSLVVFTIEDPDSPPNRKLQTYMARAGGRLTPVNLPKKFLKTIITYMKTGVIPNDTSAASPSSAASQDSRPCPTDPTPAVI